MKVLFIGATGWVGSHVVPFLQPQFELTLAAHSSDKVAGLPVCAVDICDWETTAALVKSGTANGRPFDAVVYCATADYRGVQWQDADGARQYFERCIEVNVRGTYHVFEAAYQAGISRVIHIGSLTAMLGMPQYEYINAATHDRPADLYAATKIFGENVGRSYAFPPPGMENVRRPMQVICLRLGHPFSSEQQWRCSRHCCSRIGVCMEDIASAIDKALLSEVRYGVYPVVSQVDDTYIDPGLYAELGYEPGCHLSVAADRWIRCNKTSNNVVSFAEALSH